MKRTKKNKIKEPEYTANELELIKAARNEYYRNYRAKNREKINAKQKEYRKANPDKHKQYLEKYWSKFGDTPEEIKAAKAEYMRNYVDRNKDKLKAKQKVYDKAYWLKKAKESDFAKQI